MVAMGVVAVVNGSVSNIVGELEGERKWMIQDQMARSLQNQRMVWMCFKYRMPRWTYYQIGVLVLT
jgi:hypothetical protein